MSEFSQRLAVVIGINQYENGISSLQNAVNDAEQINWILKEQHGYKTWLLLDQEATQDKLKELLTETLCKEVKPDECLLFYFAGHGKAENEDDGPQGYLIPQDARFGDASSCLPMSQVHNWLTALPCRHFLAILDCCFAGAFRWSSTRDGATVPEEIFLEHYYRFIQDPAWQVITSASYDQTALDIFSLRDCRGQKGNHSPFAAALIDALKGEADTSPPAKDGKPKGDGVITATELYLYLRDCIEPATIGIEKRQTPGLWHLKNHDRGEYIFLTPGHELNLRNAPPLDESKNPYRGLESFDEDHKDWFFGRTALVDRLYKEFVNDKAFTVVLGASGAGKSSLVRAGLIPKLRKNHPDWTILDPIRPGESPFRELNNALKKANLSEVEVSDTALAQYIKKLNESIKVWASDNLDSKLLLFIDQSEELITLCKNDIERQEFLSQLTDAITNHPHQLRVVITVRSDFEPQLRDLVVNLLPNTLPLKNTAIRESWHNGRITVPAMTRTELREAIEKPVEARVMYFNPHSLVDDLINEVADMPGALPLLSFALSELYLKYLKRQKEARDKGITIDRAITQDDYKEIGGVTQSLTQRADQEYQKLVDDNPAYEQIVRNVMLRMVAQGGGELARRRVPKSELKYPEAVQPQVEEVINRFSKARLLISGTDAEDKSYVEPAHDALNRGWPKIRNWLEEKQEKTEKIRRFNKTKKSLRPKLDNVSFFSRLKINNSLFKAKESEKPFKVDLTLQRQLTIATNNWLSKKERERDKKAVGFLWYDDPRLPQLEQIQKSDDNWFNKIEAEFVEHSISQKQWNIKIFWFSVFLIFAGISAFAGSVWWQLQRTELREKAARAENLLSTDNPIDGLVLAIQAIGKNRSLFKLPWEEEILPQVQSSLLDGIDTAKERNVLHGHKGMVWSVAFSLDGQKIVSGGEDRTVRLWDSQGKLIGSWDEPQNQVRVLSVAFSPNGQTIISSGDDGLIKLRDTKGTLIRSWRGNQGSIWSIAVSPDGQKIVSGGYNGTMSLWSSQGTLIRSWQAHQDIVSSADTFSGGLLRGQKIVHSVNFSPNGQWIVSGGDDGTVRLWDSNGNPIGSPWLGHQAPVNSVAISPDGQKIVSGDSSGIVQLWNTNGSLIAATQVHQGSVSSVAISPDGQTIVSGSYDGTVQLWDKNGDPIGTSWRGHQGHVTSVAISPDGQKIISGGQDMTVRLWDTESSVISSPYSKKEKETVLSVALSPDRSKIVMGDQSGVVELWDTKGNPIRSRPTYSSVLSIGFSPDGQRIASASGDKVWLWDSKGNPIRYWQGSYLGNVYSVAFSPDGQRIISSGIDGKVQLWNSNGKLGVSWQGDKNGIYSVAFSPNGKRIISSVKKGMQLWDGKGNPIGSILSGARVAVAFSRDGQRIVTGGDNGTVRLWDNKGNPIGSPWSGHRGIVESVAFSPDEQWIVSGGTDGTVRLWDSQGNLIGSPRSGHQGRVLSVAFSPDGQKIISSGDDKTVRWWTGDNWKSWLKIACERLYNHPVLVNPKDEVAKSAGQTCQKYVWSQKETAQLLVKQGWTKAREGDIKQNGYRQAVSDRKQASELNSTSVDAYINQGLTYHRQRNYQQAISSYSKAIELNPNSAKAYSNRAAAYNEQKDYQKAIDDSDKAIGLIPNYANAYINRGLAYYHQGKYQQAIADYDKAIELAPGNAIAYNNRALAYTRLGNQQAAQANQRKAAALSQRQSQF